MRRRQFVIAAAGTLLAASRRGSLAETDGEPPVVGFLGIAARSNHVADVEAFRSGLEQLGHEPGRTIAIEEGYADGSIERFQMLLLAVLERGAKVIVVPGLAAALAATTGISGARS